MLGSQQHSTPTRANKTRSAPLSYPKPPGREPKGKVWDGASGHWVEAEGGDAKRAKKE